MALRLLALLLITASCSARPLEHACFESRMDQEVDPQFSRHYYSLFYSTPIFDELGVAIRTVRGWGKNKIGDFAPVTGLAALPARGHTWTVSITGTLDQTTQPGLDPNPYYILSETWHLDDFTASGPGVRGNVSINYQHTNDYSLATVRPIPCREIPR